MEVISEELVEETWNEVAGFSPSCGKIEIKKVGEKQPDLLSFMVTFTQDLDQEVNGFIGTLYILYFRVRLDGLVKSRKSPPLSEPEAL